MITSRTAARRFIALAAAFLILFVCVPDALAYCRLTTCDPNRGEECEMNEQGCVRSGAGLRWTSMPVQYRFSRQGTTKLDDEEAREAVRRAFARWASVECPSGGTTSVRFKEIPDSLGANDPFTIHFRDDEWTHDDGDEALALTNHDYTAYSGVIKTADIEINTANNPFAVNSKEAGLDLESVVTHEVGHYIGIGHSNVRGSIMQPRYCQDAESCGSAELSDDDIAAVCLIYPPTNVSDGLARPPPVDRGCSAAAGSATTTSSTVLGASVFGLVIVTMLRHTRRHEDRRRRSWRDRLLGRR